MKEIGVAKDLLDSTVRFSFSVFTTREEIAYAVKVLAQIVPFYRRFK